MRRGPIRILLAAPLVAAGLAAGWPVSAAGFAIRDLSGLAQTGLAALGPGFVHRAAADRLTFVCTACPGSPMIDVTLGSQTDGTEDRVRSGRTRIGDLETICRQRSPSCRVRPLSIPPAVGWISTYSLGRTAGSTAIVLRQGDLLTIRSVASEEDRASAHAEALVRALVPPVVGR